MSGRLLLVIPSVFQRPSGSFDVETDFAHNLKIYLRNFDHVTVACPLAGNDLLRTVPIDSIEGHDRLTLIPLPHPYREDRYLKNYFAVRNLLREEIGKADYLSFSPHAKYDWSTLAAQQAIKLNRKFDMESDWAHESVQRVMLEAMPPGVRKLRQRYMFSSFARAARACFSRSSVALLQGRAVFDAYKDVAPNPHMVLNVQVSGEDHIGDDELDAKLRRIRAVAPLVVSYAGRVIDMKGPLDWLTIVRRLTEAGVDLRATWFGDGALMPQMRQKVDAWKLSHVVSLPGIVDRDAIMSHLRQTDIFLFCHLTDESPRCLGEALASGAALVGYGSPYPRELVAACGGGAFSAMGDQQGVIDIVRDLDKDRSKLGKLVDAAARSGKLLDRDSAMQRRVDLIKKYLSVGVS